MLYFLYRVGFFYRIGYFYGIGYFYRVVFFYKQLQLYLLSFLLFSMKYLLLIVAIITIGFTSLVSIPGSPYLIGGMSQADISNMFSTSVTPAGITFAIWSIIYLSWIIAGLTLSWLPLTSITKRYFPWLVPYLTATHIKKNTIIAFALAIGLTGIWLIPWGNIYIGIALLVMFLILGLLTYTFFHTRKTNIVVRSSVEITFAWIIMATALNITVWIRYMEYTLGSPGDMYYAIAALGVILLIVSWLQCYYRVYIVSIVFLWTLLGVWMAHDILEQRVAVGIYVTVVLINIVRTYMKGR